jgi:hypothetical protein
MQYMDRRTMLYAIAVTVLAAASRAATAGATPVRWKIPMGRVPAPAGVLTRLPGDGNQMALTVDDGTSVPMVRAFAQFCRDTGTRLTFFVNGVNTSWSVNAPALRPMVDSGQVQMGNHTWSHPYLNRSLSRRSTSSCAASCAARTGRCASRTTPRSERLSRPSRRGPGRT